MVGGEIVLLDRKIFREFHTDKEAYEWAMNNFESWLKDIQPDKDKYDDNNIANSLYDYTGGLNILYNEYLRGFNTLEQVVIEEYSKNTAIITNEISKFALLENIVVYRYTNKKWFGYLFQSLKPKIGQIFSDKGFMSTTLVPDMLEKFAKEQRYNCVLKLYLPIGTKGAYIRFNNSKLNEHEFLLPPNSKFRLIRKYLSFKYKMVYECELVSQY